MARKRVSWKQCMVIGCAVFSIAGIGGCGKRNAEKRHAAKPGSLTVIYSSDLLGKIRSCGCSVEDMGGLGRWATFAERARASGEDVLVVDVGDVLGPELSFTKQEAELTFEAMNVIGLDAFTPGETDFVFGLPFLQTLASTSSFPFVSANIVDAATGEPLFGTPYIIKTLRGGLRVAITGILDETIRFPAYIDASKFKVKPAMETIKRLVPEMKKNADFLVVLSHMGRERSTALAREVPDFNLVIIGHGSPVIKSLEREGSTYLLATGGGGQYVGRVDMSLSNTGAIVEGQMKLVPLEDTIPLNPKVVDLFTLYGIPLAEEKADREK